MSRGRSRARKALVIGSVVAAAAALVLPLTVGTAAAQSNDRVLKVGTTFLPPSRGNPYQGIGSPNIFTWSALFDALTWVDESGTPTPAIAQNWANTSPTTWEFRLKPGLRYSNGEKVTAAGIVATIEWLLSDEGQAKGPSAYARLNNIANAEALDELTLKLTTEAPDPIMPARGAVLMLVAPKQFADLGVDAFAQNPSGTGSYKVVAWSPEKADLTANEYSWRPAKIKNLDIIETPERSSRVQAFLSDQLDIAIGLSTENVKAVVEAGHTIDRAISPQTLSIALIINNIADGVDNGPLLDKRVRQALNYAIDTKSMARVLLGEEKLAASIGIVPPAFGHNPRLQPYPYDPDKARSLLKAAGYENGFDLLLEVVPGAFPADNEIFQLMAQQIKAVGVNVSLQTTTFADWIKKFYAMSWEGQGFETTWDVAPFMDAVAGFTNQTCMKAVPYYCDERTKPLLDKINVEFDPKKREAMLQELADFYYEEAPQIYLTYIMDITAVSKGIKGFRNVARDMRYHEIEFVN